MCEVRNGDGRLVCKADKSNKSIEIRVKNCVTLIEWLPNGKLKITNIKT